MPLKAFCENVIEMFGEEYLREPTEEDLSRIVGKRGA